MKLLTRPRFALPILALALCACQAKKGSSTSPSTATQSTQSTTTTTTGGGGTTGDPTTIAVLPTAVGVRNFDQVNATMESVTGVMGNSAVISRFKALKLQLPTDNDVKSFSFSGQGAITVLAAEYCTALVTNGAYAAQLMAATGNFNLAAVPTAAFNATTSANLASALMMKFWGSGYANNPNATAAQMSVVQLIASLTTGQANTTTTTRNAVIGACTSVLASAPTSIY